jgi:hypothetical protein
MPDTIVTFTSRPLEEIIEDGGSQQWVLSRKSARSATYLVCARNANGDVGEGPGPEPHRSGFLLGKISGLSPGTKGKPDRYLVQISEYALIDVPELWTFGRNPVHYADLKDLDIDPDAVEWQPMPESERATVSGPSIARPVGILDAAKQRLAAQLGIGVEAIEITIRA